MFREAKLSTTIFVAEKRERDTPFRVRVHSAGSIEENSRQLRMRRSDLALYDPANQPILACSQDDWDLVAAMMASGRLGRLGDFVVAYQGEVNETTDGKRGLLSPDPKTGPLVLRGSNVTMYVQREASQGESLYLDRAAYLDGKSKDGKAWHHRQRRVGFQRKSPQNNFRRLIACPLDRDEFCCDSVSYIPLGESELPEQVLLALLNSKLLDWFFRLGSTNALVNDYQLQVLPAPPFLDAETTEVEDRELHEFVERGDWEAFFAALEPHLEEPPFTPYARNALVQIVDRIIQLETERGEIARRERSSLCPEAQPLQRLVDRILFRMAGLCDSDSHALESRLANML